MAASYPTSIAGFLDKVNVVDIIDASHPNSIQSEVIAIETTLGTEPNRSTTPSPTGTFNGSSNLFSTVGLRLNNIEVGVVSDAHTQYLRKAGDTTNVITVGASTTKGLVIKGASSQSANLQEWQNTGGTVLSSIDSAGNHAATSFVKTSGTSSQFLKADGSVDSSTYLTTGTASSTYLTTATAATTYQAKFVLNVTAKTAAYTLAAGDYETMIQMNGAFAFSLTTALSGAPVGTQIHLLALTTGVSVSATGVTLNGTPGLKLRAAYSSATLICLASNNWVLIGDLSV
jgi:hypothetical protein